MRSPVAFRGTAANGDGTDDESTNGDAGDDGDGEGSLDVEGSGAFRDFVETVDSEFGIGHTSIIGAEEDGSE